MNLAVALLLVLATVSGCAPRRTATVAPERASPEVVAPADRQVTLPSGATLKVPADWRVTAVNDGLTLEDPERQLKVELVEVAASAEMTDALSAAWRRRRPGFDRQVLASSDSPGREGWDLLHWSRYRTSPAEARRVSAFVARKGALAVVVLIDGPLAAVQRRSSQIALIHDSLRPAGYVRERYRGRTPRPLDATRVAYLKEFIDQMREAAEVPGVSVVLFDRDTVLIEQGFGVRERGRPEPVTADSLYIIASNTKPLTTLLLARLVDEGHFGWDTPVTQVYPGFRIGDPGVGALFQYSNPLASAAGYIGARTITPAGGLGQAYDDVMRDKVFRPLGMNRTTFSFDEVRTDHASPHSWDLSLRNVPIDMGLNRSIIPVRPAGGAWSSVRDYARYVRLELARGRLPDGATFVSERSLLARRVPQVRTAEEAWYGMGLSLEDVKGIRVISHGGSMFGYKSNFFVVPDAGVGGVVLTNADSGWNVARAVMRRTLELIYDGTAKAEEDLLSEVKRLAGSYRNAALGEIVVRAGQDEVVFQFGGWKSRMATTVNPDGTTSFVSVDPGIRGFEFHAPAASGAYTRLTLRAPQHTYEYESGR